MNSVKFLLALILAHGVLFQPAYGANVVDKAGDYVSDSVITGKVKTSIANDRDLSASDIHVETKDRVVKLKGCVENVSQYAHAVKLVNDIDGVRKVESGELFIRSSLLSNPCNSK